MPLVGGQLKNMQIHVVGMGAAPVQKFNGRVGRSIINYKKMEFFRLAAQDLIQFIYEFNNNIGFLITRENNSTFHRCKIRNAFC